MTGQLVEAIDGAAELALAGRAGEYVRRLAASDALLARLARRDAFAGALARALHSLLTGIGLIAVLVVAIGEARSGALAGVLLAAVAFLFLGVSEALAPLPTAARRLGGCRAAAARLAEVCEQRPAIGDPSDPRCPSGLGMLALEGVAIRYGEDQELVLEHADLELAPGERVALIGDSGAGKTTVAELLVRFLDPDRGRVTLDGIDVRALAQDELRRAVLLCDQDAHLFNTTLRENLLIAREDATEPELWDALRAVELDEFAAALPDGLETRVGQQGELVSGGQRQRLALARALLSDARFLILDEPAAHLDAPLARRVMQHVLERSADCGLLVITHAADALDGFDRVLRLERGRPRLAQADHAAACVTPRSVDNY
jgi:thiol reductant ABC exporter CydC subunit